jgi:beta-lactamase regulating signal transducer with metallopeptidase domain
VDAVLNWIWQGSIVAMAAAGMLRVLEPARAHLRYRALWIVLGTILVLPLVPLAWAATVVSGLGPVSPTTGPVIPLPPGGWLSTAAVIAICAAWTMALAIHVFTAALALRRARRECRPFADDRQARLPFWTGIRSSGRQTRLMVSEAVGSAAVLAGRTPIIALAPSMIDRLADDELDRVVVHEWAHVQRRDDLAHVLQVIVRLFAGWHPAVWWCDRRLHLEREIACDEMAVRVTGSTKAYAACLATLASLPSARLRPLHAVGALSGSNLGHRIVRILSLDRRPSNRVRVVTATAAPILIGAFAFVVGGYRAIGAVPATAEPVARTLADSVAATANSGRGPLTMPLPSPRSPGAGAAPVPRVTRSDAHQTTPPAADPYTMLAVGTTAAPAADRSPASAAPLPSRALAAGRVEPPHVVAAANAAVAPAADAAQPSARQAVAPWSAAAGAGVSVGGGAQDAALATAGFFNRLGRKIADSF